MISAAIQASLHQAGFEAPLNEVEASNQRGMRQLAQAVMEPLAAHLDKLSAAQAIAADSRYWLAVVS
ncbi:hypothetical protein PSAC2689_50403 [Paraburkholderia sacchari]|uniref:hypothetical protein n=1 Tax=Paraburkholderia sacchari TaxID=159450 RepID=UPI0039A513A6